MAHTLAAWGVDLRPGRPVPRPVAVTLATLAAAALAVGADALLVLIGTDLFPSTSGYAHFRLSDYGPLTVIGVAAAGVSWPMVARITSAPRRLFLRLAVGVSALLLAPDAWLLASGQPPDAVAVLVAMHLVIALVTYHLLVHGSPLRAPTTAAPTTATPTTTTLPLTTAPDITGGRESVAPVRPPGRGIWLGLVALVSLDSVLGVAALVVVPIDRPDAVVPDTGRAVYLAHAGVGVVLGLGAVSVLVATLRSDRLSRWSALVGLLGTALGAGGGSLAVYQSQRILGMGLMLLGALVAGFAFLTPVGFADDDARPAPFLDPVATGRPEWQRGPGRELTCRMGHPSAQQVRTDGGHDPDPEEWAATCIAAGTCPICPNQRLEHTGDVSACPCCESVYRRLADDGDGAAWIATPGRRVLRP